MRRFAFLLLVYGSLFVSCEKEKVNFQRSDADLVIFFISDQHGQLRNFSKIKSIIDQEKSYNNVVVVCSGDMFSGNPIVDNFKDPGFPMVDVMNQVGFNVITLGNHDFDYGELVLKERVDDLDAKIICANLDVKESGISPIPAYMNLEIENLKITFLGLIETNGLKDGVIPSTHPGKVKKLHFERPENVVGQFAKLKEDEDTDLFVALTHLGFNSYHDRLGDSQLANEYPFFDLIIGGHAGGSVDTLINNIPVFQVKSHLRNLGKIEIKMDGKKIKSYKFSSIELNNYKEEDKSLKELVNHYNDNPYLNKVIGYAQEEQSSHECGCLYTDAIKNRLKVDLALIDKDGIFGNLDEGEISRKDIYQITRYNHDMMVFELTVSEIKRLLKDSKLDFYYSGLDIDFDNDTVIIKDNQGESLEDLRTITVGINDYIPALYGDFFSQNGTLQQETDAQTIISYIENENRDINYDNCNRLFQSN